jgi:hypothetical protein
MAVDPPSAEEPVSVCLVRNRIRWRKPIARARFLFAATLIACAAQAQLTTCPGSGMSITGGRLGDPWSFTLSGPAGAAGVLASDLTGGPIATPLGSVCLGLTSFLATMPLTLDATGQFGMSGVLPLAPSFLPSGSTLFTQAALAHPSLPGGYSITNGLAVTIRPPALFVFRTGLVPTLDRIDAATDTITLSAPIPGWQGGPALRIPRLGWIAFRIGTAVAIIDDLTGAVLMTIPGAWDANSDPTRSMAVSGDGAHLYVSSFASTWTGTSYSLVMTLRTFSLPSGVLVSAPVIPFAGTVNKGLYPVPGTPIVYAAANDRLYVLDVMAGVLVNTIPFPGPLSGGRQFAFVSPGRIWVVVAGSLIGIDTTTHAQVAGPSVLGSFVVPVSIGPGPSGPALWALESFAGGGSAILQAPLATLVPQTLGTLTPFPISPDGALSAGGTGMLVLPATGGSTLWDVNVATSTIAPVASGTVAFEVLRSGTLTKTYSYGNTGLVSTQTDPTIGPGTVIPLPNTALAQVLLVSN